jgi:hypothetical protein
MPVVSVGVPPFMIQNPSAGFDVASSAITASANTSAFTLVQGVSYQIVVPVTAVSGTTPTLDIVIQESEDFGSNWFDVYHFPRITSVGMYRSPKLPMMGNRVRYLQLVTGTTPSFTRAITRNPMSDVQPVYRQMFDRAINLTALNSATPALNIQATKNVSLVVNIGAATTAPALQLQGTEDNGATWINIGGALTAIANSTVKLTVVDVAFEMLRAVVSTAGAAVTMGYVKIKGY